MAEIPCKAAEGDKRKRPTDPRRPAGDVVLVLAVLRGEVLARAREVGGEEAFGMLLIIRFHFFSTIDLSSLNSTKIFLMLLLTFWSIESIVDEFNSSKKEIFSSI